LAAAALRIPRKIRRDSGQLLWTDPDLPLQRIAGLRADDQRAQELLELKASFAGLINGWLGSIVKL
jgi:hypothetical protein